MTHVDPGAAGANPPRGRAVLQAEAALVVVDLTELRPTYSVGSLLGHRVVNDAGEDIGRIDDLMIEDDRLAFAVLSVGGFLGLGGHRVVVAFDDLLFDDNEVELPGANREALRAMTAFDRERVQREHAPLQKARKGVRDSGTVVSTAGDEPISGIVADITDGDR
jgi:hypothetical protein